MIKEIITYPIPPSPLCATDIRIFDNQLFELITDLEDTINANNLEALAAFQIGNYFNVVVVKKEDGSFLELINPRLLSTKDKVTTIEKTAYFPGLTAEVTRHDKISVIYQDRTGAQQSLTADGNFSVLLQRKIDYTFGGTFLTKLSKEEREKFEQKLEFGIDITNSETCPTTFKRDYFTKVFKGFILVMFALLLGSLFISDKETLKTLWNTQLYLSFAAIIVNIGYFFYAHYEAKKYMTCISCQSGNIIGTTFIGFIKLSVLMIVSYFVI
jgi:peptide deformylase